MGKNTLEEGLASMPAAGRAATGVSKKAGKWLLGWDPGCFII